MRSVASQFLGLMHPLAFRESPPPAGGGGAVRKCLVRSTPTRSRSASRLPLEGEGV
jgi:hypothetical protein